MSRQLSEAELDSIGDKIFAILPGAFWEVDNEGQLVIYTNLWQVAEDQIVEMD